MAPNRREFLGGVGGALGWLLGKPKALPAPAAPTCIIKEPMPNLAMVATKAYVDNALYGITWLDSVQTMALLPAKVEEGSICFVEDEQQAFYYFKRDGWIRFGMT